ncbi:MAG: fatty acid--CoA ligase family protein [Nakamurella sp.]
MHRRRARRETGAPVVSGVDHRPFVCQAADTEPEGVTLTQAAHPVLRLAGSGDRPAVTEEGLTWSYRELSELIDAYRAPDSRPLRTAGSTIETVVTIFAAAAMGRPVLVTDPAGPPPVIDVIPPDTFLIAVTSGTSGRPKPVLRTAKSWVRSFAPFTELTGIGPADRVLLTGPLHATLHLFAAVHTLAVGAELTDQRDLATAVHAVPAVLADLLDGLADDAALQTAVVAGSALPADLAERALRRRISVVEYYGAAELSFVAARRYPQQLLPFPGAEIDIRDGVLWARSSYLSLGYPPGVTGPFRRDDDGFGTVGDLAEWTPSGGLQIRGRGDAAITTGGATVVAEDIEAALGVLPGVAAVAVIGLPHTRLGQLVTAVIEPIPGADLRGLRAAARRRLRGPSLPRRWLLTDRLPRTPSGKVNRFAVARAATRFVDDGPPADRSADGRHRVPPDAEQPDATGPAVPNVRPLT